MSKLAQKIQTSPPTAEVVRRGPANACFPLYGAGDLEDWNAVEAIRVGDDDHKPLTWRQVQEHVDSLAGVARPLPLEKFRYHWRRRCFCWPEDLRR